LKFLAIVKKHSIFVLLLTKNKIVMKTKTLHYINSYQCHRNEVYLVGKDEYGKDFTIVFGTIELLECIDIPYMKEQAIKHIKEIGEGENLKESSQKFLNN
tara:strand:+ start:7034 stop:7333 length:300 start_codon:yes stop_codon:yes gene_type:complete